MAAHLTPELAPEAIGLLCLGDSASTRGSRPNPCKLKGLQSERLAVVQPNGHRREEVVELATLRLWLKGNHDIGPEAAKRAELINALAELQHDAKENELTRHLTREEVMANLGSGINPLVLMRVSAGGRDFSYVCGQIVAIKDGGMFMVKFIGTKHAPQAFQLEKLAVPVGIDLETVDRALLTRVFGLHGPLPGMVKDVIQEVRTEADLAAPTEPKAEAKIAPKPAQASAPVAKAPAPTPARPPAPAALPPGEPPPKSEKRTGTGKWIIVDTKNHLFLAKEPTWARARWLKDIQQARIYETARGVAVAASKAKAPNRELEVMEIPRAQFFSEMWYRPRRAPEPERPAVPPAPTEAAKPAAPVEPPVLELTDEDVRAFRAMPAPQPSPEPVAEARSEPLPKVVLALRRAILERGEAEALCLEARVAEARARAAYEAELVR